MTYRPTLFAAAAAAPLAAVVWFAGGEEPPPAHTKASVSAVVEKLGSPDRAERLEAEKELLRQGLFALEHLPPEEEVRDPAVRAGLARVRKRLEELRVEQQVQESRVWVEAEGPLGDFAGAGPGTLPAPPLGVTLMLTPEQAGRRVALDSDGSSLWQVIDDVSRQAGLWPGAVDEGRLSFRERTRDDDAKRIVDVEAFRLAAGPVTLRPIAGDGGRLVRVPLEVRAEPRLRPLFVACAAGDFRLTGAGGETLPAFTPGAKVELPVGGRGEPAGLRLDFVARSGSIPEPLTLSGRLNLTVAAGSETFTGLFEDIETSRGKLPILRTESRGGVTFRVREAALNDDGTAEVELAVVYDRGGPAFESHRTWANRNDAYLSFYRSEREELTWTRLDPEPGFEMLAQADGGAVLRYRFTAIPAGAMFVAFNYVAPTRILEVPVEFEIGGLPATAEPRESEDGAAEGGSRDADL